MAAYQKFNKPLVKKQRNNFRKMTPRQRRDFLRDYKQVRGCFSCSTREGKLVFLDTYDCPVDLSEWVVTNVAYPIQRVIPRPGSPFAAIDETVPTRIWSLLHTLNVWCERCASLQMSHPIPYVKAA